MKPYEDVCAPCEQNRDQLRSALSEGDKDLPMEDWLAHINPPKVCVYSTILSFVAQEQGCSLSRFGLKPFEAVHI